MGVLKQFEGDKFIQMLIKCRVVHFRHIQDVYAIQATYQTN